MYVFSRVGDEDHMPGANVAILSPFWRRFQVFYVLMVHLQSANIFYMTWAVWVS